MSDLRSQQYWMENPSAPIVFVRFRRMDGGAEETVEVHPLRLEYVSSVEKADMLKMTLLDPDYQWIDSPLLDEDLKTEVEMKFGYNDILSDKIKLVFFRQRPNFGSGDAVATTLVAYDKGVFLMFPIEPKMMEKEGGYTVEEIVLEDLADVMKRYPWMRLKADFGDGPVESASGDTRFEPKFEEGYQRTTAAAKESESSNIFSRGSSTPSKEAGSTFTDLFTLAATARLKDATEKMRPDVWVHNDVLHFHPVNKKYEPIARFDYFTQEPGARLLSFEPEVAFQPGKIQKVEVNEDENRTEVGEGGPATADQTVTHGTKDPSLSGDYGEWSLPEGQRGTRRGEEQPETVGKTYTYTPTHGDNPIPHILEQPQFAGSSEASILEANGWATLDDMELAPGDTIKVPVPSRSTDGTYRLPNADEAVGQFLQKKNQAINATAVVVGNPRLRAGFPVDVYNVGRKWTGRWVIREVRHTIDESGYRCRLLLTRDALMWGENLEPASGTPRIKPAEPEDPTSQEDQKGDPSLSGDEGEWRP